MDVGTISLGVILMLIIIIIVIALLFIIGPTSSAISVVDENSDIILNTINDVQELIGMFDGLGGDSLAEFFSTYFTTVCPTQALVICQFDKTKCPPLCDLGIQFNAVCVSNPNDPICQALELPR